MYLGRYVFEKKLVNSEALLESILEQMESSPLLLRILREMGLLPDPVLVEAIDKSISMKKSVTEYLIEQKLISKEDLNKVFLEQAKRTKSLAQILIEKDLLTADECKKAIEESQQAAEVLSISSEVAAAPNEKVDVAQDDDDEEISWAALETLKETGAVSEDEIKRLEEKLKKTNLENNSSSAPLETNEDQIDPALRSFLSLIDEESRKELLNIIENKNSSDFLIKFQSILGAAKLSNLQILEKLLSTWNKVIQKQSLLNASNQVIWNDLRLILDLLDRVKVGLKEFNREAPVFQSEVIKQNYMILMKKALELGKKVG
ncbi:MAG: hypothetical protein OHK0056_10230 [Bacteriovoracaceae bacterium]